jgi:hypothetical protein
MSPDDVGPEPGFYSHLAPELRTLQGDGLRLWGDAGERRRALEAIVAASETGSADLAAVARVDAAIAEGLLALGLPRGAVGNVRVEFAGRGWIGQKRADCDLVLDGYLIGQVMPHIHGPERVFHTWIHESLHARRPYAKTLAAEQRPHRGYEEGMVEGLARLISRDRAGVPPGMVSFEYYVRAYTALAKVLHVDVERLWRGLWLHPPGLVRAAFSETVATLVRRERGIALTANQLAALGSLADRHFDSARVQWTPNEALLNSAWQVVLS